MMTDRLNQPLNVYDLVLISHPKTSVLLRCMVVKIMTKTVKVVVLPESELENETAQYCQKTMADVGDDKPDELEKILKDHEDYEEGMALFFQYWNWLGD